jgi:hypothetical protein
MKIKHLFSLVLMTSILFISACNKEEIDTRPECEKNKTGTITVSNNSTNPYDFYIDGAFQERLSGGTISKKFTVSEGNNRKVYVKQVSGFILYPTEKNSTFNVVSCSDYTWQVP